jgi:hypothetical protein
MLMLLTLFFVEVTLLQQNYNYYRLPEGGKKQKHQKLAKDKHFSLFIHGIW